MYRISQKQLARFWMRVKKDDGCWLWQGACTQSGYGRFELNGKSTRAHKISYYLNKGLISNGNLICHGCDNPRCVNPDHLWEGTHKENIQDCLRKKRRKATKSKYGPRDPNLIGINLRKETGKWRVRVMSSYKNHYLGQYDTKEEAIAARDAYLSS